MVIGPGPYLLYVEESTPIWDDYYRHYTYPKQWKLIQSVNSLEEATNIIHKINNISRFSLYCGKEYGRIFWNHQIQQWGELS